MANRAGKTRGAKSALNDLGTGPVDSHGAPAITMYVTFGAGTSAGAVQLEGGPDPPVAWGVSSSVKYVAVNEAHRYVRARISTAVVGGTVDVHVVTGGFASGEYLEAG